MRLLRHCSDEPNAFAKAQTCSVTNQRQSAEMRPAIAQSAVDAKWGTAPARDHVHACAVHSSDGQFMLGAYPSHRAEGTSLKNAAWVDLLDPSEADRSAFEQAFGLHVPTKEQIVEIETTSRLRIENDALYLTAPLIFAADGGAWIVVPTGFVLAKEVLLTVRFAKSSAFDAVIAELGASEQCSPALAFARLLEVLVDRMADLLESSGRDLDDASHVIFRPDAPQLKLSTRNRAAAPADDPHRPHQRTHGAHSLHLGLPRPHGQVHRRAGQRMDRAGSGYIGCKLSAPTLPRSCISPKVSSAGCNCSRMQQPVSSASTRTR